MIVPISEINEYFRDFEISELDIIYSIQIDIEKLISDFCHRTFEETSYSLEKYDGNNNRILALDNYPIISVDRVSVWSRDVISIKNTNSGSTASVSATSTGLRLVKDGTADSTILFATYTTLTSVVSAINSLGNGWVATLLSSTYSSFKSTELIKRMGLNAINNNFVYLSIPEEAIGDFEVDENKGWLIRELGWPSGSKNVYVDYSAGYTSTTMPASLKQAVKVLTQYFYNKKDEESFGLESYRLDKVSSIFEKSDFPKEVLHILNRYKRCLV